MVQANAPEASQEVSLIVDMAAPNKDAVEMADMACYKSQATPLPADIEKVTKQYPASTVVVLENLAKLFRESGVITFSD